MGLIDVVLATLCLNLTCPGDYDTDLAQNSLKKLQIQRLAEELAQEHLTITTLENENLSGSQNFSGDLVGTGVAFELFNILRRKFGFNYTLVKPQRNAWGAYTNGALGMLKKNQVDMVVAFLPVLPEYTSLIDYSPSLDTGEWVVLMKRPAESATGSGLLAPFTLPVWILILISLAVVGPVIYFIIWVQAKLCKDDNNKVFPLPQCIWFVYGALLKQGTTLSPTTDSARLLFSTWWIFITILTAFYTANLTAFLTLSKFTLPISEPKDIGAKRSRWVSTQGNALEDEMRMLQNGYTNDSSALITLLGRAESFLLPNDTRILNFNVLKRDTMFIREKPIVEYLMYEDYKMKARAGIDEAERCTFVITKFAVATFSRAFAYAKNFKYKELFNSAIRYMVEGGIIKYKLREDLPDTEICPLDLGNTERQLRNSDLLMTYEIVGGGFVISAVVFIVELIIRRKDLTKPKIFKKQTRQLHLNNNHNNLALFQPSSKFVTPPPSYYTIFNPPPDSQSIKKKNINGRDYWVYDSNKDGEKRMIPLRTPSALLFQYTN